MLKQPTSNGLTEKFMQMLQKVAHTRKRLYMTFYHLQLIIIPPLQQQFLIWKKEQTESANGI